MIAVIFEVWPREGHREAIHLEEALVCRVPDRSEEVVAEDQFDHDRS